MPELALHLQMERIRFLLSLALIVVLGGAALYLLQLHAGSKRVFFVAGYALAVLGVFWVRSLGQRLSDAGWPRWAFWPYFLFVFTGSLVMHFLKIGDALQVLVAFVALQIPAALWRKRSEGTESVEQAILVAHAASPNEKNGKTSQPVSGFEFAVYAVLIAGLWDVLHLLRGDVTGHDSRIFQGAIDLGSGVVAVGWIVSVHERLRALEKARWTLDFCVVAVAACLVPFAFKRIDFRQMLVLFIVLEAPLFFARRKVVSAKFLPNNQDY